MHFLSADLSTNLPPNELAALGFVSLCIGGCVSLSWFATLAVRKALLLRTKRWIILGSFGGLFLLLAWTAIIVVLIAAAVSIHQRKTAAVVATRSAPASTVPQTLQGQMLSYHFVLPPGWKMDWDRKTFDFSATHEGCRLGIVAGKSVGSPADIAKMARDKIKGESTRFSLSETSPVEIDGRRWLRFTADFILTGGSQTHYYYLYHVYSGDEGMFQVIGWRTRPLDAAETNALRDIAASFRFPDPQSLRDLQAPEMTLSEAQTLQGSRTAYRLTLPAGWRVKRDPNSVEDLRATRGGSLLSVIAEPTVATNSQELLQFVLSRVRTEAEKVEPGPTSTVLIDGREWLHFSATLRTAEKSYVQEGYVYAGSEGAYQLLGLMRTEDFPREEGGLRDVLLSFRFPPATEATPQSIYGKGLPYSLTLPAGWRAQYPGDMFDVLTTRGNTCLAVAAQASTVGTTEQRANLVQERLRKQAGDLQLSETSTVKIDGRDWLTFTAKYRAGQIPFTFHHFVYVGPEGTFQITAWTPQESDVQNADALREIAMSFRFPPESGVAAKPSAMPSAAPTASPLLSPLPLKVKRK